jgi:hypothetical protein
MRHQENFGEAHLRAADGVVAHKPRFVMSDDFLLMAAPYRACAGSARLPLLLRRLRSIFLLSRPPLLTRTGIRLFHEFDDYSGCSTRPVVPAITRSLSDYTS